MSKAISYFDWENNFRKKPRLDHNSENETKRIINKKDINSLGFTDYEFRDFMKKWKENNL